MRDASREPREAFNNDATYSESAVTEIPWANLYRALSAVRTGLQAIEGGISIEDEDGTDNTERAVVFGKLVQGLALSTLAVIFDRAFIVDETVEDPLALTRKATRLSGAAAEAKFDEVIRRASGAGFFAPVRLGGL